MPNIVSIMRANRPLGVTSTCARASRPLASHQSCHTPGSTTRDFPLVQHACLPVALQGQLALKQGEALEQGGVAMLPDDARANERGQLDGGAALVVVLGGWRILPSSPGTGSSHTSPT